MESGKWDYGPDVEGGMIVFEDINGKDSVFEEWVGKRDKWSIRRRLYRDRAKYGNAFVWLEIQQKNASASIFAKLDVSLEPTDEKIVLQKSDIRTNAAALLATLNRKKEKIETSSKGKQKAKGVKKA